MSIPAKPTLTQPPTAPQSTDQPNVFEQRADAFVSWQVTNRDELSDAIDWQELVFVATTEVYDETVIVRGQAESARDTAQQYRDTTQQYRNTTLGYRNESEGFKDSAETAAAAAQSAAGLPSLAGNGLNVLTVTPGEDGVEWQPGIQSLYTEFTESGTFTPDSRARWAYVECVGAGASGGASVTTTGGSASRAGGEGGHVSYKLIRLSDIPSSVPVTVGAGGSSVTSTGGSEFGIAGGDSSFGDLVFAFGGAVATGFGNLRATRAGSVFPCTGGAGGGGSVSDTLPPGPGGSALGGGGGGASNNTEGGESFGGNGRGGDGALLPSSGSAEDGEAPGGGGGGIRVDASSGTATSGAGGDGIVRVWQW